MSYSSNIGMHLLYFEYFFTLLICLICYSFILFSISFVLSRNVLITCDYDQPSPPPRFIGPRFFHGWNTRFIDQLEFSSKRRGAAVRPRSCGRFTAAILQSYPLDSIISSSFDDRFADFGLKGCRTRMEILARIEYTIV